MKKYLTTEEERERERNVWRHDEARERKKREEKRERGERRELLNMRKMILIVDCDGD